MKKTIWVIVLVVAALAVVGVSAAFAQGPTPYAGNVPMTLAPGASAGVQGGGMGYLHGYMVAAFAEKLALQAEDVNARLAAGESMYDMAIASGVKVEDFPALMVEVRSQALSAAVKDGVITQEQADWMSSRDFGLGNGGGCPMHNVQGQPLGRGAGMTLAPGGHLSGRTVPGSAGVNGNGMMGGGFGWQNQQANP